MKDREPPDANAFGLMILFCSILGMQQVALKAAASDVAPILQIAIRSGIGAILVWGYMLLQREHLAFARGNWKPGLVVGLLFTIEYLFLGEALRFTSASHTVVFLYTAPIFAALILHFLVPAERMNLLQWAGIGLAFLGIVLAFLYNNSGALSLRLSNTLIGDGLALLAGAAWGATTVIIRSSRLSSVSPQETLLYQLLMAFALLSIVAFATGQLSLAPTKIAIASIIFQGVFVGFLAFLIWFWLLRNYHASPIGIMSFMTPVFGVILGSWLLSEPLEPSFLAGSILVIVGVVLVSGERLIRQVVKYFVT